MRYALFAAVAAVLSACAQSSVTDLSQREFILSTEAAPVCGSTGAQRVASRMAAVEVLRRGFDRYIVTAARGANNVSVYQTGPTYANTYGNASVYGNTLYGSSTTYFGGRQTIISGTHDAGLRVVMLRPGEPGYSDALDARTVLGEDWQELVANGVRNCAE